MGVRYFPFGVAALMLLFLNCFEDNKGQSKEPQAESSRPSEEKNKQIVANYDSLLQVILPIENKIMINPSAEEPRIRLIEAAYDKNSGLFYCVGKGVENPKQPLAAQHQGMRRAEKKNGERWALYLKAWQKGKKISIENTITGKLQTSGTLLYEKIEGDTLFQLIALPSDSVQLL